MKTVPILTTSWTVAWRAHKANDRSVVPGRISVGAPRFWPGSGKLPGIQELKPLDGLMRIEDLAEFERRYLERLDRIGLDQIQARLQAIYVEHGGPLALCCFEPPGVFCHRRLAAMWIEEKTGQEIPEIANLPTTNTLQSGQLQLRGEQR